MSDTTPPIAVGQNAPLGDPLAAAGRYLVVILTALPVLLTVLGTRDLAAIVEFFRGSQGATLISAAIGFGTIAWGLWKTRKRAQQITTVAASPDVPSRIAHLKS